MNAARDREQERGREKASVNNFPTGQCHRYHIGTGTANRISIFF
jgi:hypothetical protein